MQPGGAPSAAPHIWPDGGRSAMDTVSLTLTQARQLISTGELTPDTLLEACLDQIHRLNPSVNAFITVIARSEATKQSPGPTAPLSSLPLAVKDLYDTAGVRTTAGTR